MVKITGEYQGGLHCTAVHGPSGTAINTDAPKDNQGRGESFSPTDLVATALATCAATTMAIVARRHGVDLAGLKDEVTKEMSGEGPRRIARLAVRYLDAARGRESASGAFSRRPRTAAQSSAARLPGRGTESSNSTGPERQVQAAAALGNLPGVGVST